MGPQTAFSMLGGAIFGEPRPLPERSPPVGCRANSPFSISITNAGTGNMRCLAAGFGILGPYARSKGWAPGAITDWQTGASGWILWVSLAIMVGDSVTSLGLLSVTAGRDYWHSYRCVVTSVLGLEPAVVDV